jgi:hypothetical protein
MNKSIGMVFILLTVGCAKVQTLNLKKHSYNVEPKKIVWLQIAGFDYRQIPLIRFSRSHSIVPSSLEKFDCIGGMWSYNLTKLRPSAEHSFISQITGRSNIKSTCFNAKYSPFWSFISSNIDVGIFETRGVGERSLSRILQCSSRNRAYDRVWLWRMASGKNREKQGFFHYLDLGELRTPGIYYDRSCSSKACFSSFYSNILSLFERFSKDKEQYVFIVRDFSYAQALQQQNIPWAREILSDLEKTIDYFFESLSLQQDTLLLVSGAATKRIELPKQGREWNEFIRQGKGVLFHRDDLSSTVLAVGARSENFCGIYEESDLVRRIIFSPKQPQGIEKFFSNP